MDIKTIPLADIKLNTDNPRDILSSNADTLKTSLEIFGQLETLVVDVDMNLISGHQRLSQLKKLGKIDAKVSVYRGTKAEALGVILNHEDYEGEFEKVEFADMVRSMPNLPEFKGLHFDRTIRNGTAINVGKSQISFGTHRNQIEPDVALRMENQLRAVKAGDRGQLIYDRMGLWLNQN